MRPRSRVASALSVSLLLVALSGCQTTSPTHTASSATATTTEVATVTPAELPKLPVAQLASGVCGQDPMTPAGGLVVTQSAMLGNLAYPDEQIPSGQTGPIREDIPGNFTKDPAGDLLVVNPNVHEGGGGYVIHICNPSSQPHTVIAVQAGIAQITPFTDKLEAWALCSGGAYLPAYKSASRGGCGGADIQDEYLHAPFAADAQVGATVTATQTSAGTIDHNYGPLPAVIPPGQMMSVEVGVTPPSTQAYYIYSFGLTIDGAKTGVVAYSLKTLFAPVSVIWTGKACLSSAMQTQIAQMPTPTTNSAGYICPAS